MAILIAFSKKHNYLFCVNPFSCIDSYFHNDLMKECFFFMGEGFIIDMKLLLFLIFEEKSLVTQKNIKKVLTSVGKGINC